MNESPFAPYTVARWGVYLALGVACMSIWLGHRAGASLDYSLLRSVFIFVIVTVLAFAAEAVLSTNIIPSPRPPASPVSAPEQEQTDE